MMTSFTTLFTALLAAASTVVAAPAVQPNELIVYSPDITSPSSGVIWKTGSSQAVTWDTSNIPAEKENSTGLLLLGYLENDSENLDIAHPLATDFPLKDGTVNITVPNKNFRTDYVVVLFGDSGNKSPQFTILQ